MSADLAVITLILIYIAFKLREIQQGVAAKYQQPGITDCLDNLKKIREEITNCLHELTKIQEEICCEFEESPSGLKLRSWGLRGISEGIRSDLKGIQEEISSEFETTPSGLKLTRWGLKDIGEGISSDLKEILEEIRSK